MIYFVLILVPAHLIAFLGIFIIGFFNIDLVGDVDSLIEFLLEFKFLKFTSKRETGIFYFFIFLKLLSFSKEFLVWIVKLVSLLKLFFKSKLMQLFDLEVVSSSFLVLEFDFNEIFFLLILIVVLSLFLLD